MNHVQVLREIESRGLTITIAGADLRLQGPRERMDVDLIGMIKRHKAELLAHLNPPAGFPLTELQRGYLIGRGELFEIGNVASHVYHEIEGSWDVDRLEAALRSVVARHDILRTRFVGEDRQVVEPEVAVCIERIDLRGRPEPEQRRFRAELREQRSHLVLPADRAPMLAVAVTLLSDDRMVLHVNHDGLILDAISIFLFFRAWRSAYDTPDQAWPEEMPFENYLAALAKAREQAPARRSRDYWLGRLDELAPHPDLPLRTSPSTITTPRFRQHFARLDRARWTALKATAARHGITPSGLLFAIYMETLLAWGAGSRFTINTTVANRPPVHPRSYQALGNFGETMLVEVEADRGMSFLDRARELQARLRDGLDHRHFSGIEVMRELARRRGGTAEARMPYTFNSAIGYPVEGVDGSALELFGPEVYTASQTPQVWLDVSPFEQHGGVVVQFDSVDGLFPDGMIEALTAGYQRLLHDLRHAETWAASTFDLLPAEQRERRRRINETTVELPDAGPADAFLDHARRTPDAAAIITGTGAMTYRELRDRVLHAAAWLRAERVRPDELVGLVMRRGPEQIVGMLATVLAGAAYLPIDAGLPAQRVRYLLTDGRVRRVLSNVDWMAPDGLDVAVLRLDTPPPAGQPDPPRAQAGPDDLAYVLYTSGTTGDPKGVMISRRSVLNVVADCNRRFDVGPEDRFFGISAFTFDLSVYDVFGALSAGAAVVLPDHERAADPAHWLGLCAAAGVTVWNSVPSIVSLLHDQALADGAAGLATLRLVMLSGDRIPPTLPAALRRLLPGLRVVSLGGPTETTVWNISHVIAEEETGERSIPYGRPNANNRAYVLDASGADTPDWVVGEICAAGVGLARGYWGDENRTAQRFLHDDRRGERIFRTGDLGRFLPSGEIDILGRADFQIKVNGYRIEAGEVETRLTALDSVHAAVVLRQAGSHGDRLVAHLVAQGERPGDDEVREALRDHLPEYMVPSALYWHDRLPTTRNGKVDRAALSASVDREPAAPGGAAPESEVECALAALWGEVLRTDAVDATTTLYDLGGDSLAAARILTRVRRQFGVGITLDRLPQVATVRAMAAHIESRRG